MISCITREVLKLLKKTKDHHKLPLEDGNQRHKFL